MSEGLDVRAKAVFDRAADLAGPERQAYLDSACAGDAALLARAEQLLAAAERDDSFLSGPTLAAPAWRDPAAEMPGAQIGPYTVVKLIGEGGFGLVFLAEQERPVRRRVALKIIKLGMDTRAVAARFEQERQTLAGMDHPNIAKVFDAGATATGRPFFVMELVNGEPITDFCDRQKMPIPARISLFLQVCAALQHAHTKGIIHRDIKPSNILVGDQDGPPVARVIDFGIAKATGGTVPENAVFTELRQPMGTPEYMSPEQAAGSLDIDTRTDVYSLGVVLYELLAGVPPFDSRQLRSADYQEIQRIIREVEPPRPSMRVSRSIGPPADAASLRTLEPSRLRSVLRAELDWIVMRAMDKDRARRYDSPGALAADLRRYLDGRAVEAAPPSRAYRARKFVKRHAVGVGAGAAVAAALIVGLGLALWQARVAQHQADMARRSQAQTEQVADFQAFQLRGIDAEKMGVRLRASLLDEVRTRMTGAGKSTVEIAATQARLADSLDQTNLTSVALRALDENIFSRALTAVHDQFRDQPLVRARLLFTLASTLMDLGLQDQAVAPMTEALQVRRRELGDNHPDTLDAITGMGNLSMSRSQLDQAETYYREALAVAPAAVGENSRPAIDALNNVAEVVQMRGRLSEAEPLRRQTLEKARRYLGPDDPDTLQAINNMGGLLFDQGKRAQAEPFFREALERRRRTLGDDHRDTCEAMNNMATVLQALGRLQEAEPLYREALDRSRRTHGEDFPDTILYMGNLGYVLFAEGKLAESEPFTRGALERRLRVEHEDHWETMQSMHNLGVLLEAQGHPDQAEQLLRRTLDRRRRVLGPEHPATLQSVAALGVLLCERGLLDQAEPLVTQALEQRRKLLGNDHADTLESLSDMGSLRMAQGRPADALPCFREALAGREAQLGKDNPLSAAVRVKLAECLLGLSRYADAEPLLLESERQLAASLPRSAHAACVGDLVRLYEAWDKAQPGQQHDAARSQWIARQSAE